MLEHISTRAPEPDPAVHDRLVERIEETLPEGRSPKGRGTHIAARFLFAFGALALAGTIVLLYVQGGWTEAAVGLGLLFLYAFLGSTPWFAGVLRARDRREAEVVVDHELNPQSDRHESPFDPAPRR